MKEILELLRREKDFYEEIYSDTVVMIDACNREDFKSTSRLMRKRNKICDEIEMCEKSLDSILSDKGIVEKYHLYRQSREVKEIVDCIEEVLERVVIADREAQEKLSLIRESKAKDLETLVKGRSLLRKYKPYRERRAKFFDRLR
jgi:hypothetical protein